MCATSLSLGMTWNIYFDPKLVGGFNPFEKIFVKMGSSSPIFRVKIRNIWNHHLETLHSPSKNWVLSNQHSARSVGGTSPQVHVQQKIIQSWKTAFSISYWTRGTSQQILQTIDLWKDMERLQNHHLPTKLVGAWWWFSSLSNSKYHLFLFFPNITRFFWNILSSESCFTNLFCPLKNVGTFPHIPQQIPNNRQDTNRCSAPCHSYRIMPYWLQGDQLHAPSRAVLYCKFGFQKWLAQRHFEKSGLCFIRAKLLFLNLNQGILNRIPLINQHLINLMVNLWFGAQWFGIRIGVPLSNNPSEAHISTLEGWAVTSNAADKMRNITPAGQATGHRSFWANA